MKQERIVFSSLCLLNAEHEFGPQVSEILQTEHEGSVGFPVLIHVQTSGETPPLCLPAAGLRSSSVWVPVVVQEQRRGNV